MKKRTSTLEEIHQAQDARQAWAAARPNNGRPSTRISRSLLPSSNCSIHTKREFDYMKELALQTRPTLQHQHGRMCTLAWDKSIKSFTLRPVRAWPAPTRTRSLGLQQVPGVGGLISFLKKPPPKAKRLRE